MEITNPTAVSTTSKHYDAEPNEPVKNDGIERGPSDAKQQRETPIGSYGFTR